MRITPAVVAEEHEWVRDRADVVVPLINVVRMRLGRKFDTSVDEVSVDAYETVVDDVFADGDRAVNATALIGMLRELDVEDDYPGFVVDEFLGRELAAIIAGDQPLRLLAESTFHYADVLLSEQATGTGGGPDEAAAESNETAGADDLDAALAAGFQTRLPGWDWTAQESPFGIERE